MSDEYDGIIYTLVDEEGAEHEFEHLSTLETDGATYVALTPIEETAQEQLDTDGELVILKQSIDEKGEEMLESVTDEDELSRVAALFAELLEEDYDIES